MPDKSVVSLRVGMNVWPFEAGRKELIDWLTAHPGQIDEVCFFTSLSHPPIPLDVLRERAGLLSIAVAEFKAMGIKVGINHLSTVGHLDENLEFSLREDWQRLVDITGAVSASCYCASDPAVQEYIRASYVALALARPEFIWVDDDVRLEHHPKTVAHACFCDYCLDIFATESGRRWTREQLLDAFGKGMRDERMAARRAWLAHNRAYLTRIMAGIRDAVDSVDDRIVLGFMTTDLQYSGLAFDEWLGALSGKRGLPTKFRPGGGFYSDDNPLSLLDKAHSVGRQVADAGVHAIDVQYEHENFPYYPLRKSRTVFVAEIAAAMAAGCDGTALNILGNSNHLYEEFGGWLSAVAAARPFFDEMAATFTRAGAVGVWPATTRDRYAAVSPDGAWPSVDAWTVPTANELFEIGIPPAYSREAARVVVLAGDSVLQWSADQLRDIFRGGVMLDGAALNRIEETGLADLVGFATCGSGTTDLTERLTDDPLNAGFCRAIRDCRPSFWQQTTHLLQPVETARPLSECIDLANRELGCCSGVFENHLGGRVAVFGYFPWNGLQGRAKTEQLRAVTRWLSRESLPGIATSFHRLAVWNRTDVNGNPAIFVLNASIDPAEDARVTVKVDTAEYEAITMTGGRVALQSTTEDTSGMVEFTLPTIGPWAGLLVRARP